MLIIQEPPEMQGSLCAPDNWTGSWLSTESGTPWWVCGSLNWRDIPSHDDGVRVRRLWLSYLLSLLHVYNIINACIWICIRLRCIVCSFSVCAEEVLSGQGVKGFSIIAFSLRKTCTERSDNYSLLSRAPAAWLFKGKHLAAVRSQASGPAIKASRTVPVEEGPWRRKRERHRCTARGPEEEPKGRTWIHGAVNCLLFLNTLFPPRLHRLRFCHEVVGGWI